MLSPILLNLANAELKSIGLGAINTFDPKNVKWLHSQFTEFFD